MSFESSSILNQVPSYIFSKDLNSVFLGCNNAFAQAAGLTSPKDIIGKTDFDLIWAESCAELYQDSDRKVLAGEIQTVFLETQVAFGKISINIVSKVPLLDTKGQKIGVIGSYSKYLTTFSSNVLMQKLPHYRLSKREIECARLLIQGLTFKAIASKLNLSSRTVEHYIENIRVKMNVANKDELIIKLAEAMSS